MCFRRPDIRTGRLKTEYRLIVLQYSGRLKPCTATVNPLFMIYQRNFIKELSFTAVGIFVVLLAILVSTQAINLLGRGQDKVARMAASHADIARIYRAQLVRALLDEIGHPVENAASFRRSFP